MIYLAGILLAAAYFIHQHGRRIASRYGKDVVGRRWEVDNNYTRAEIANWVVANPQDAAGYASVLFPWDIAMAACLGFGFALAGFAAGRIMDLPTLLCGALLILPAAFVALDVIEDMSLRRLFSDPAAVTDAIVEMTRMITGWKLLAVKSTLAQTALAMMGAVFFSLKAQF